LFFRYSVFYDEQCSCENILKEKEEEGEKCTQKCRNGQNMSCGGEETESIYETGSRLPGPVRHLKLQESTEDQITIAFDPPERNGTELSGYEIKAFVMETFSKDWVHNQTWLVMKTKQQKLDLSNLLPSTKYNISITSKNEELAGGENSIECYTKLREPDPKPNPPKIVSQSERSTKIEITRYKINNNGPITKYLVVVFAAENDFVQNNFDENLLTTYDKAKEQGTSYYIAAEIDPFQEDSKLFTIGDGQTYGKYFNAPLPSKNVMLHVLVDLA
jgi:Fibronectin type III domain/TM proximal of protein tyrosine phosphatase, receptor type J